MSVSEKKRLEKPAEKLLDQEDLVREVADDIRQAYEKNSHYNMGAEVEDLVFRIDEDNQLFEPLTNEEADQLLRDIDDNTDTETELTTETLDGEELVKSVKVKDSPFEPLDTEEPFYAEIDNDLGPRQSEVATDVVNNPADLLFRLEYIRRLRDSQLQDHNAFEAGLSPEIMFPDIPGEHSREEYLENAVEGATRRKARRYEALVAAHGPQFNAMTLPASTQLNTGLRVDEEKELDELVYWLENGGSEPALADVVQAEAAPFVADPVVDKEEGTYQTVIEAGREMIYDLFIAESDAASRKDVEERWGDQLERALPTNDNYGRLEGSRNARSVEDVVDNVLSTPGIMSADIDPSEVHIEGTGQTADELVDDDEVWVIFDNERMDKSLGDALESGEYTAKFLKDGELVNAYVKHDVSDETFNDYVDTAKDYAGFHSSFVRPDFALKFEGIAEGRNHSNSPRTNQAVLNQKALWMKPEDIQESYARFLSGEDAKSFREGVNLNGMDVDLNGVSLRDVLRENADIKAEGLKESFPDDQLPYTFEVAVSGFESGDFGQYLDSRFDDLDDFLDQQIRHYNEHGGEQGNLDLDDWQEEYAEFRDWFVETAYSEPMRAILDSPTTNQQLVDQANRTNSFEAYKQLRRE